jgi:hypothetical protein
MAAAALPVSGAPIIGLIEPRSVSTYLSSTFFLKLTEKAASSTGTRYPREQRTTKPGGSGPRTGTRQPKR